MKILGLDVAPPADGLPADAPRGKRAESILAGETLAAFRHYVNTQTVVNERLAGRIVNHVLAVETQTIDSSGYLFRQWHVTAGSVEVRNLGSNAMTVTASGPTGAAPNNGVGIYVVPAGAVALVNLASRQVTIYGTQGDRLSYQAFTAGGLSASNWGAVDGGVA